ncbi:hypothetical protein PQJ75_26345 [Rhodoplanes sp. TEM]|uniref:DNA-binding protein n=1 Tax=Rhodoplanes tepidamans TaxID=200616 RepID=A0ABT5J6M5_RHOTP|nr:MULTISPECIES: hypothetical protein [Rhodoplanes]MDC7785304.1 hypothetical protein [Rhodoplanes tepidamans]MDC7987269.1 hypothetical protein [Rhodoplanes sp. TEM]MDQ0353562.1 hypothetical protein [Rhodoplanes tepidamans]
MATFEFCIVAAGLDPLADDFETRFLDAGCDDATVAFQKGRIVVDFSRDAPGIDTAVASAVADVVRAGATVVRIEPDPLVTLADMAARSGLTRAAVSHYFRGQRGENFPPPVARVTSESPLWDWATVARWLFAQNRTDRATVVAAAVLKAANAAVAAGEQPLAETLAECRSRCEAALGRRAA